MSIHIPRCNPLRLLQASSSALVVCAVLGSAPLARAQLAGTVVSPVTITGSAGVPIDFSMYLPPGYDPQGTTRYPVVYHLHGLNGSHSGGGDPSRPSGPLIQVSGSQEEAVALGLVERTIIVFPDGYRDSFWADSSDGQVPAESDVIDAIIPFVDANFLTLRAREQRIVQGFSMGGFGAAKFAAKFPALFGACVIYDGALLTWEQLLVRHPPVAAAIFGNDEAAFDLFSPWSWVTQNGTTLASSVPFRQAVGSLLNHNLDFQTHLIANGVTPSFVDTPAGHDFGEIIASPEPGAAGASVGQASWAFIQSALDVRPPTLVSFTSVADEDGWIPESSETSGVGATPNGTGPNVFVGDNAFRQQLRALLSFDTSGVPEDAQVVSATLTLTRTAGAASVAPLGALNAEIVSGTFGSAALASSDFQASSTSPNATLPIGVPSGTGQTAVVAFDAAALRAINGAGRTQIRLAFAVDDDGDSVADNVAFASGNHPTSALRPRLDVTFR